MSLDLYLYVDVDTGGPEPFQVNLFDRNITHNVTPMWHKAGVYDALYNSEGRLAGELVPVLESGLADMAVNYLEYRKLNPPNGWGDYDSAYDFLLKFMQACRKHPKSKVHVSK